MFRFCALLLLLTLAACAQPPGRVEREEVAYQPTSPTRAAAAIDNAAFDVGFFASPDGVALPYRLHVPAIAPGETRPLVLVLHGSGAIGTDNAAQLGPFAKAWALPALAARFPAFVLVPQAPTRTAEYQPGADGLLASRPGASLAAILALVEQIARVQPVDPQRIYVVGFSMGGSAALQALLADPDRFAAAVTFSGIPPDRSEAARLAHVPLLLVHGTADAENPFEPDRAFADALAAAGGTPRFRVYRGMDHRLPPDMVEAADWRSWLFAQQKR